MMSLNQVAIGPNCTLWRHKEIVHSCFDIYDKEIVYYIQVFMIVLNHWELFMLSFLYKGVLYSKKIHKCHYCEVLMYVKNTRIYRRNFKVVTIFTFRHLIIHVVFGLWMILYLEVVKVDRQMKDNISLFLSFFLSLFISFSLIFKWNDWCESE